MWNLVEKKEEAEFKSESSKNLKKFCSYCLNKHMLRKFLLTLKF